jgi:predicted nuclease of predicted toxin-antitoxin system
MKRLLLDENLPKKLAKYFSAEFEVMTVPDLGWQSKTNGELLSAMNEAGIEFLVTGDKNLSSQQNLAKYSVKVLVIETFDTRLEFLTSHVSSIEDAIQEFSKSALLHVVDLRSKK